MLLKAFRSAQKGDIPSRRNCYHFQSSIESYGFVFLLPLLLQFSNLGFPTISIPPVSTVALLMMRIEGMVLWYNDGD